MSKKIAEQLCHTEFYMKSKNVLLYYPLKNEVDLLSLLDDCSKTFYLPKIHGNNLVCCPYKSGDRTSLSCFNTKEPLTKPCEKSNIDLAIVPALACDINKYRLGYGGGYYDRFLQDFCGITAACIPYSLSVDTVYAEPHDVKLDYIITEKG